MGPILNQINYRGGPKQPKDIADTFRSTDTFELLIGLGEGPWWGPAEGAHSFFIDQTPVASVSGMSNFSNISIIYYPGSALGELIKPRLGGFSSPISVGVNLLQATPVVRAGSQLNIDWVEVRLVIGALYTNTDDGVRTNSAKIKIEWKKESEATWRLASLHNEPTPVDNLGPAGSQATYVVYDPEDVTESVGNVLVQAGTPPAAPTDLKMVWLDSSDNFKPYSWNVGTSAWVTTAVSGGVGGVDWNFTDPNGQQVNVYNDPEQTAERQKGDIFLRGGVGHSFNGASLVAARDAVLFENGVIHINDKITSTQVREVRFAVDNVAENLDYRITQISPDTLDPKISEISFESIQEVKSKDYTFPNTAMLQVVGQGNSQMSSNPTIQGIYKMRIVRVPSNFNPTTRVYTGIWDGTYQLAWTDSVPWVFMDFVENTTFGLSSIFPHVVDKWKMYEWAQHCDAPVDNGSGGLRPRWTFNHIQREKIEAKEFAQQIATAGGARYMDDGNGLVTVLFETPGEAVVAQFTNENVAGGLFRYSSTDRLTRSNQIIVKFKNPELFYRDDTRMVQDDADIADYGVIPEDFEAIGCRNKPEALARARHRLITAQTEKRFVNFQTHRKGRYLSPWQLVAICDADASYGISGMITGATGARTVSLLNAVALEVGYTYTLQFDAANPAYPSTSDEPYKLYTFTIVTAPGTVTSLTVDADLPATLPEVCAFSVGCADTVGLPKVFRVLKIEEVDGDPDSVQITALVCNRAKWDYIDGTVPAIAADDSMAYYNGRIEPVTSPDVIFRNVITGSVATLTAALTWARSETIYVKSYKIFDAINGGPSVEIGETSSLSMNFENIELGEHIFTITPVDFMGRRGRGTVVSVDTAGADRVIDPVTNVRLSGGGSTFTGTNAVVRWDDALPDTAFSHYLVSVLNASTDVELRAETQLGHEWTYDFEKIKTDGFIRSVKVVVYKVDVLGNISNGVEKAISNPAPAAPTVTLSGVPGGVEVRLSTPTDPDFVGYKVWASTTTGFTPNDGTNLVFTGAVPPILSGTAGTTIYVRTAAYDLFGQTGLTMSAEVGLAVGTLSTVAITGTISTAQIADDAVTNAKIGPLAVDSTEIASGAVVTAKIGAAAVTSTELGTASVIAVKIGGSAVGNTKIAAGAVIAGKFGALSIATGDISNGGVQTANIGALAVAEAQVAAAAISTAKLATGAVTSNELGASSVITSKLAALAVTSSELGASSVIAGKYGALSIAAADVAAAAIITSKLATGAVTSNELGSASVVTAKIAASAITSTELGLGSVIAGKYGALSLASGDIAAGAVTAGKYGALSVAAADVAAAAIITSKLATGAVTSNELGAASVIAGKYGALSLASGDIAAAAVITSKIATSAVTATELAAAAVTNAKIATDAVQAAQIQAGAVIAGKYGALSVAAADVAAAAIITSKLATGAVTSNEIGLAAVINAKIATDAVQATQIQAGAVIAGKYGALSVAAADVAAAAIITSKIAASAVTATEIGLAAVTNAKIATDAVQAAQIQAGAVVTAKIAALAVTAAEVAASAITTAKIAASAVTATELGAAAVTNAKIATDAVQAAQIQAGAVVAGKYGALSVAAADVAAAAIITSKLGALAVDTAALAASAVTGAKIAANTITAGNIAAGTITAATIAAGTITTTQIAAGTIVASNIAAATITASRMLIGDNSNAYADADMQDATFYAVDSGTGGLIGTSLASASVKRYTTTAQIGAQTLTTGSSSVEPSKAYYFTASIGRDTATSGNPTMDLYLDWYSVDAAGAETLISSTTVASITATTNNHVQAGIYTSPAATRRVKVRVAKGATAGTSSLSLAGPVIRRAAAAELIVDGTITATKIAADTITATQIAASAITSSELAAGAVIAGKITAGTIVAADIAATTITAAKIAAGTITATEIAADTITATQIAASAITSSELAAGAVIAGKITAGTIVAADIAATTITAAKIAAGAITASKIYVTDNTMLSDVGFEDSAYWNNTNWTFGSTDATAIAALAVARGIKSATGNGTLSQSSAFLSPIATSQAPVEPGKSYRLTSKWFAKLGFTGKIYLVAAWYKSDGVTSSTDLGNWEVAGADYRTVAAVADTSGTCEGIKVAPSDAMFVRFQHVVVWSTTLSNAQYGFMAAPRLNRAVSAELIVDGTIVAAKIAADTITATQIAASAITSSELAAGAVIAGKITAGTIVAADIAATTITAAKIVAGTITTTEIAANTIVAADIVAGTITATEIAANTITAAKIAAGTLTATEIAANTITAAKIAANTINASRLVLTDISNMLLDTDGSDSSYWSANGGGGTWVLASTDTEVTTALNVARGFKTPVVVGGTTSIFYTYSQAGANRIAVEPGKAYRLFAKVLTKALTTQRAYLQINWYKADNVTSSSIAANSGISGPEYRTVANGVSDVPSTIEGQVTAPSDAAYASFMMVTNTSTTLTGAGYFYFAGLRMNRAASAELIVDGTITAAKIAADTITATQIAAGAITASELAAGAVIAGKITAGTIVAADIAASTITASQIAAGTITASRLVVQADNLAPDPFWQDTLAITRSNAGMFLQETNAATLLARVNGMPSAVTLSGANHTGTLVVSVQQPFKMMAKPGIVYELEATGFNNSVTSAVDIRANWYQANGTYISSSAINFGINTTTPTIKKVQTTAPALTAYAQVQCIKYAASNWLAGEECTISGFRMAEAMQATMIVDGTIVAAKIAADTITATQIAASAITSSELAAGAVIAGKITAGTIVAADIAANTITAAKITAGTITATEIAATTITAAKIAANTITASQIAADTITATQIAASAITASELAAGAVVAGKITAGTIVAADIAANTITAAKIAAGTITATEIAGSTITGAKIVGGTITANLLAVMGDSLVADPNFANGASWYTYNETSNLGQTLTNTVSNGGWYADGNAAANIFTLNAAAIWSGAAGPNYLNPHVLVINTPIPIMPGEYYEFGGRVNHAANHAASISINWLTAAGAYISTSSVPMTTSGGIHTIRAQAQAPTNAGLASFVVYKNGNASAFSGAILATGVFLRQCGTGTLIVDGTISATKIAADTITATQIAAGAITASELAAGAVVAGKITAGTIVAADIAANTITAAKITAGTITATEIAADAIQARHLLIGNFDNIIPDGDFRDSVWCGLSAGATTVDLDSGWTQRRGLNFTNGTYDCYSDYFPVQPGATYRIRCRIWNNGGSWSGYFHPMIHMPSHAWYSLKHGSAVTPTTHDAANGIVAAGDTGDLEWIVTNPTGISLNANRQWQLRMYGVFTGGPVVVTVEIVRVSDATLIKDGAITTAKIVAGAITAGTIATDTITATQIAAGAISASELAANSVIAGKIQAGTIVAADIAATTITAAKIAAGTITATEIAAGTITAAKIAAGTISVDKLMTNGTGNLLFGSDMWGETISHYFKLGWNPDSKPYAGPMYGVAGATWDFMGTERGTVGIRQTDGTAGGTGLTDFYFVQRDTAGSENQWYAARPGIAYTFAMTHAAHRCRHNIWMGFYDSTFTYITETGTGMVTPGSGTAADPTGWTTSFISAVAPANTRYILLALRREHTTQGFGHTDSYSWITQPRLYATPAVMTSAPPWSPGGETLIQGGRIVTNSITANQIAAGTITAAKITVSSLSALSANLGTITAGTISLTSGSYVLYEGAGFGVSSDLVMWYGASSTAIGSATKTNGKFALATDGKVYIGSTDQTVASGVLAVAFSPTSNVTTHSTSTPMSVAVTATPSGGSSSYTYVWTVSTVYSGATPTLSAPYSATCTVGVTHNAIGTIDGIIQCLVTDTTTGKTQTDYWGYYSEGTGGGGGSGGGGGLPP